MTIAIIIGVYALVAMVLFFIIGIMQGSLDPAHTNMLFVAAASWPALSAILVIMFPLFLAYYAGELYRDYKRRD